MGKHKLTETQNEIVNEAIRALISSITDDNHEIDDDFIDAYIEAKEKCDELVWVPGKGWRCKKK